MTKWVYSFGAGHNEGRADMRNLLGGKGANLAEMATIGLPVPPGFTITTEVCTAFYDNDQQVSRRARRRRCAPRWPRSRRRSALKFGDPTNPLLVSVRSGARVSMPGMMDTVLNLGLNDATVEGLARSRGNDRASPGTATAASSRCTARSCSGVDHHRFEEIIEHAKIEAGVTEDTELTAERLAAAWSTATRTWCRSETGKPFPEDPYEQLWGAIGAVFGSRG